MSSLRRPNENREAVKRHPYYGVLLNGKPEAISLESLEHGVTNPGYYTVKFEVVPLPSNT